MELDFKAARWQQDEAGVWLCLLAANNRQAREFCGGMKPDKLYTAKLGVKRNKRSLEANAYFWVLAGKLSARIGISPEEIYRECVRDIGDNYTLSLIPSENFEDEARMWADGHLGWWIEEIGPCDQHEGYMWIRKFYGCSYYNTAQMSRLIDLIVQECKEQDIETMTPQELEDLKSRWDNEKQTDKSTGYQPGGEGSGS